MNGQYVLHLCPLQIAWPSASIVVSSESHNEWIIANSHLTFMSTSKLAGHLQVLL